MALVAVIEKPRCINGSGCDFLCGNLCPVNRTGGDCITVDEKTNKPIIDEDLCIGCGICPKRCPTLCIDIVNLPEKLKEEPVHRYGVNTFELFHLPIPKPGMVVGLLGRNGIGKSTALNILAGTYKPNFGEHELSATPDTVLANYTGTILGDYFKKLYDGKIRISYKPQRIELLQRMYKATVRELLKKVDERNVTEDLIKELEIEQILERKLHELSGGELQKVAIIAAMAKKADIYYFDEPASFCDITTRIKVARLIRALVTPEIAVIVVEHDLATLDYISDEIQIIYGVEGVFGIVSQTKAVRRGINEYLDGYLPDDNVRFRDYKILFTNLQVDRILSKEAILSFPSMKKRLGDFSLEVNAGSIRKGEVLGVMGANGLGKSTFLKLLAGELKAEDHEGLKLKIAYKVQYPDSNLKMTVKEALQKFAGAKMNSGWFSKNIVEKLGLLKLMENEIPNLSGGELQKLYTILTLAKDADVYAFDEPAAFVDVEDRMKVAEVIKDFMIREEKCAIVVDHDVQFIDYVCDSMLVFEGRSGMHGTMYGPVTKREGMNRVLKMLDITYRVDKDSGRPRINKPASQLDREQRSKGEYYYR